MCGHFLLSYAASWTRPRPPLPVRGTCRDQLDAPASAPSGAGHMSGSAGRARVRPFQTAGAHVGISWTRPASVPSGVVARPGRPLRPAWHGRQGTTGPGDALMVGIPAVRLRF